MKKLCMVLTALFCLLTLLPAGAEAALVSVRGEARDGKVETALKDARYRAVKKTLRMLINEDNNPNSIFQRILADFERYCDRSAKPEGKRNTPQGLWVFTKVMVDEDAMAREIKKLAGSVQDKHADKAVYSLIRATGAKNNDAAAGVINRDFSSAFVRLGLACEAGDSLQGFSAMAGGRTAVSAAEYERQVLQKLQTEWLEVGMALIGEVNVSTEALDNNGCLKKAVVNVKAVDLENNKVYCEYNRSYLRRGPTEADAETLVVQKAAIDMAEFLASETLKYWQNEN